jgi:hypothetical protein
VIQRNFGDIPPALPRRVATTRHPVKPHVGIMLNNFALDRVRLPIAARW